MPVRVVIVLVLLLACLAGAHANPCTISLERALPLENLDDERWHLHVDGQALFPCAGWVVPPHTWSDGDALFASLERYTRKIEAAYQAAPLPFPLRAGDHRLLERQGDIEAFAFNFRGAPQSGILLIVTRFLRLEQDVELHALLFPYERQAAREPLRSNEAMLLLLERLRVDEYFEDRVPEACVSFRVEHETDAYLDLAVVESRTQPDCPGDPAVAPTIDRFRVDKLNGMIYVWSHLDGSYTPYPER